MDLSGQRESDNVQDTRGGKKGLMVGGGIVGLLVTLVAVYFGVDPQMAQQVGQLANQGGGQEEGKGVNDGYDKFSKQIIASTEDVWSKEFQEVYHTTYKKPTMKLFSEGVHTGCGDAPSSVGPFYCPADQRVYLDPTFFNELRDRFGGSDAQFSQAYVIAHEVGHHVQHLLGYGNMLEEARFKREGANGGIRLELQADYLAGVWAHHAKNLKINDRDVKEAVKTAQSIGDNRIQKKAQGWVSPEKFTHGTDEQRTKFFLWGYETGDCSKARLMIFFDERVKPTSLMPGR